MNLARWDLAAKPLQKAEMGTFVQCVTRNAASLSPSPVPQNWPKLSFLLFPAAAEGSQSPVHSSLPIGGELGKASPRPFASLPAQATLALPGSSP